MLQCLACELCRDMLKKIKVFHLHWGEKNPENVSINISWCKIPNSTFQALHTSKIEDWMVGMCRKKCFLSYVAGERGQSWAVLLAGEDGCGWNAPDEGGECNEGFRSKQSRAANPVHGEAWVGGDADQNAVLVVFHRQGAGAQDHGWDSGCLSGGTFLKAEREPDAVGKAKYAEPSHPIGWTHLPHTWDAARNGWEPTFTFKKIFFISLFWHWLRYFLRTSFPFIMLTLRLIYPVKINGIN